MSALISRCIGIELGRRHLRAVQATATGAPRLLETPWDPARPREAVAVLRESLGYAAELSLTVGIGWLQVKRVELPPLPATERARILALDPHRYFADGDDLVVSLVGGDDLAFAVSAQLLATWREAFEEWAPVARVEPAPLAVARALGESNSGAFRLEDGDVTGTINVADGRLRAARRLPGSVVDAEARSLPAVDAVPASYLAALGAARGVHEPLEGLLLPPDDIGRLVVRRRWGTARAAGALVAALLFSLWAADTWRARTVSALETEIATAEAKASAASEALAELMALEAEARTLGTARTARADPFAALAVIGARLPSDAVVLNARATGDHWQLEGTARDASALVPVLDGDARLDSVRFLSATSRFRERSQTYETFSLALRYRPQP